MEKRKNANVLINPNGTIAIIKSIKHKQNFRAQNLFHQLLLLTAKKLKPFTACLLPSPRPQTHRRQISSSYGAACRRPALSLAPQAQEQARLSS